MSGQYDFAILEELRHISKTLEKIEAALKKDDAPAKEAVVESEAELTKKCAWCRYCEADLCYNASSISTEVKLYCKLYAKTCKEACPQFERR